MRSSASHPCGVTYELARPHVKSFDIAIDAGCRIGEFTFFLQYDFAHVYAFDPNVHPGFARNVDMAGVTHYGCALGDELANIVMYGGMHTSRENVKPKTVQCFTLDRFTFSRPIGLIKVDVEGFEHKVINGASGIIERDSPVIIIEQNHVTLDGVKFRALEILKELGYEVAAVCPRGWDHVLVR